MIIHGANQFSPTTAITQPQPVVESRETENASKVFSSVDEAPSAEATQNELFGNGQQPDAKGATSDQNASQGRTEQEQQAQLALEQQQLKLEQVEIQQLKDRDLEVRQHEAAHSSVGGAFSGSPTYDYETGPDGKRYAVGGEVQISTSKVADDPEQTLQKAETIRAAALAPADPSSQDRRVAAQATQMSVEARSDILENKQREAEEASKLLNEDEEKDEVEERNDQALSDSAPPVNAKEKDDTDYDPFEKKEKDDNTFELPDSYELSKHFAELGAVNEDQPAGSLLNLTA